MTDEQIQELRCLGAAATPRPWSTYGFSGRVRDDRGKIILSQWLDRDLLENAALIVAMRNALPELLDTIDAQARRIAELEGKLASETRRADGYREVFDVSRADSALLENYRMLEGDFKRMTAQLAEREGEIVRLTAELRTARKWSAMWKNAAGSYREEAEFLAEKYGGQGW